VPRSSFHRWYQQCQRDGEKGLEPQGSKRRQRGKRVAQPVCDQIVQVALAQPGTSAREMARPFTDREGCFVSETHVFRLLRRSSLV
jgi:transposase